MDMNFDEMLSLAGVDPRARARQERLTEGREKVAAIKQRRLAETPEVDPRVQKYVMELDAMANALGDQIETLYGQANAAASIDPRVAGALQEAAGELRVALGKVYHAIDEAKECIAPVSPRTVAP